MRLRTRSSLVIVLVLGSYAVKALQEGVKAATSVLVKEVMQKVIIGTIKETVEEIVIDGFFETAIQSAVRMTGGNDEAGHWLSTLFTSLRETANFGSLIGGSQNLQGVAGQVQYAMGTNQEFQSIVSAQTIFNEEMSDFENEAFLTSEMERLDLLEGSLQDSKISLGRILATGILGGLSLIAPSLAGFNIYAISKLVGGIANKFSAKLQNRQLVERNSKMKLIGKIISENQKTKMGKTPVDEELNLREDIPQVPTMPEGIDPMIARNPIELEFGARAVLSSGFAMLDPFGKIDQGDDDIRNAAYFERKNQEVRDAQATIEHLKKVERDGNIIKQLYEAKQKIFDNIELFGFDPHDPDLKYPLTDYDNIQSILFKTLLNLIYENKGTLESVYKGDTRFEFTDDGTLNYKFKDLIRPENLGVILGIGRDTVKGMLKTIDTNSQSLTLTREHRNIIRKIRDSTEQIFDHIKLKDRQSILRGLFNNYIKLRYVGGEKFVMQLLAYIDDYTDFGILGEQDISTEKLKMSKSYLEKFRYENIHFEELSKYFRFMVNIYISGESNLGFTDSDKFKDFKKKVTSLVYRTLIGKEVIKETHTSKKKFEAVCLTLTALTNYRYHIRSDFLQIVRKEKNPKDYFTLNELSAKISPSGNEALLSDQFRYGSASPQLYNIITVLNKGIKRNMEGCFIAKNTIEKYLRSKKWSTSELGMIIHPIYEQLIIEYLKSKGIRVAHEKYVSRLMDTKPDNLIERKSIAERRSGTESNFEKYIEALQNILTIPDAINLISVDYTYSSDLDIILEKFDKDYQSDDRLLIIVLLGQKSDRDIKKINDILQKAISKDDGSRHLENIRIITSEEFGAFLGFDGNFEKIFNRVQELAFNIFHSANFLFEALRQREQAENWLNGQNEDWMQIYCPQRGQRSV